ncbi:lytic polysaccharide monooxygenase [Providencia burhodogranariea]|uniref:Chitin-binding type-4 domain-containing protein n=1 Tax=Providencia burhodogranariea DSM 19968 TaxID=1141662 RepID=K8WRJ6_9GAMM|nr:lytic polysaccharide monooxygenase [Providencia burhodogranariea]EKT63249.1 hypothetical protein OOA_05296 [Providencia burhodogranariea DSM 19968]
MKNLLLLSLLFCFSNTIWAHGYVEVPNSRAYLCKLTANIDCGDIQYEPQSIEGAKGFPALGPEDGEIASAGISSFANLDVQNEKRWIKNIITNSQIMFNWRITARHKTTKWEYFITKSNWNPNQPLTRSQLVLEPFCQFHKVEFPNPVVEQHCKLPSENKGYHIVLAVWTIEDTPNAFYQVVDLDIK